MLSITETTIFDQLQMIQNEKFATGLSVFDASLREDAVKWGKTPLGKHQKVQTIAESGNDSKIRREVESLWSHRSSLFSNVLLFSTMDRAALKHKLNKSLKEKEDFERELSPEYQKMMEKLLLKNPDISVMSRDLPTQADIRKNASEIAKAKQALDAYDKQVRKAGETVRDIDKKIERLKGGASSELKTELDKKYPSGTGKSGTGNFIVHF
jgi:hypothetical protein